MKPFLFLPLKWYNKTENPSLMKMTFCLDYWQRLWV